MDFIKDNINIKTILNSEKISIKDQISFLKKIYKILDKIESNDVLKSLDFHLGDIHEANFIYNKKTNDINVVDIDSSYFEGAYAPNSKYLTYNDKLWFLEDKYPVDKNFNHIPNKNTTILCYIYLLLNYLTNDYSPDFNKHNFCETLNIMISSGFEKELCDDIFNIYTPNDNKLDCDLIDTISPKLVLKFREIKKAKK